MKSNPTNHDFRLGPPPSFCLSAQEHDMFVMKAITLMAKDKIDRTLIKNAPIIVSETDGNIICEQKISKEGKMITLRGAFKRLENGRSLPIPNSFCRVT
jgi:hypothetical protein